MTWQLHFIAYICTNAFASFLKKYETYNVEREMMQKKAALCFITKKKKCVCWVGTELKKKKCICICINLNFLSLIDPKILICMA